LGQVSWLADSKAVWLAYCLERGKKRKVMYRE
jgi:uncharacterized protein YqiB (DUF1249 family)